MKYVYAIVLLLYFSISYSQNVIDISGQVFTNLDDSWQGVNIERDKPVVFSFKNNSITSRNNSGYMLQAGDEAPAPENNNLDGSIITGNMLKWNGTSMESITHGIFTGHNKNVVIRYNNLEQVPMGIIRKSGNNMFNTTGGIAYNIVKGGAVAIVVKGMSNVNIYNNTLFSDRTTSQTWRPLVDIYTNTDFGGYSVAHGVKIFNNIFYTRYAINMISIDDDESLKDFQSDYNLFWSEAGSPLFSIKGTTLTFEQWKAKGYDIHSVVINPQFKDHVSFVPSTRLEYGTDLGTDWSEGLSSNASWGKTAPATTTQTGKWQVGAIVLSSGVTPPPGSTEIKVYPNPAKKSFTISNLQSLTLNSVVRLTDITGRLQMEYSLNSNVTQSVPINLNPGLYILNLIVGSEIKHSQKLIVVE